MRRRLLLVVALFGVAAADPPPGAVTCSGCHPATASGAIPPLVGRDPGAMLATMLAYRDGTKPATVMDRLMKGFSPDELRAIAAWVAQP